MSEVMGIAGYEWGVSRVELEVILKHMPEDPEVDSVYFELYSDMCATYAEQNGLSPEEMQEVLEDIKRGNLPA